MNYYDALGVSRNATQLEVEAGYQRTRGIPYSKHPLYTSGSRDPTEDAIYWLRDPQRRKQYDAQLSYEEMSPFAKSLTKALGFIVDDVLNGDIPIIRIVFLSGAAVLLLWLLVTTVRYFWIHPLF